MLILCINFFSYFIARAPYLIPIVIARSEATRQSMDCFALLAMTERSDQSWQDFILRFYKAFYWHNLLATKSFPDDLEVLQYPVEFDHLEMLWREYWLQQ